MRLTTLRTWVAVAALIVYGALITLIPNGPVAPNGDLAAALQPLLLPLGATIVGLLAGAEWGRTFALASGIAVAPWATVLAVSSPVGTVGPAGWLTLGATAAVILALAGPAMTRAFAGDAPTRGRRRALIRWAIVLNLASVLSLYLFVMVVDARVDWHQPALAAILAPMLLGALALARGRTVGLLLLAAGSLAFVPVGIHFAVSEATHSGEMALFVVLFLPGVLATFAVLAAFLRPMARLLREG